jgi:ABC-type uncharacterized transport system substrate-binding protein
MVCYRYIKKLLFQWIIQCLVVLIFLSPSLASGRVLVVHSYHAEFEWVHDINAALEDQLTSASVPYRIFYMDTKRKPDNANKIEAARQARHLIEKYSPAVVIAVDDNVQKFVVQSYTGKSPIQFVFAGVNADLQEYGYPAGNVTGILERTYPDQVLKLLKMIKPSVSHVGWVSDDSATANLVLRRVRRMAESGQLPMPITGYLQPGTFEQWKTAIHQCDTDPNIDALLIPLYHTVKSQTGSQSVLAADVMRWTVNNTRKPIVGLWPFSAHDGAVCAVVVDPREHGKVAALMAKQILAGHKAGGFPIVENNDGFVIINMAAATKLGIEVPFEVMLSADDIIE